MKTGTMHRSLCIYLTTEDNLGKPQPGDRLMKTVRPVSLQMGSLNDVGRIVQMSGNERDGRNEESCTFYRQRKVQETVEGTQLTYGQQTAGASFGVSLLKFSNDGDFLSYYKIRLHIVVYCRPSFHRHQHHLTIMLSPLRTVMIYKNFVPIY